MTRIVILGCAGSGKSTLARRLGEVTGAPVICLDRMWRQGPEEIAEFRARMLDAHSGAAWISDGNFAAVTFDIRLPRATLVVWLERRKSFCVRHAIARVFVPHGEHRIGRLAEVLRFIWNFNRINRPLIEANRIAYGANIPVCKLTNDQDITVFIAAARAPTPH